MSNKSKAKKAEKALRFVDNGIGHLGERLRPLLDRLLVETPSTPRAHQVAEQIEALLLTGKIVKRTALPVPPKGKRLADRPWEVRIAEQRAVKEAERAVSDAWHRAPRHLTSDSPEAKAHWEAPHWQRDRPPHPLDAALAKARRAAREDFRRKLAEEEAAPQVELPPHISRIDKGA